MLENMRMEFLLETCPKLGTFLARVPQIADELPRPHLPGTPTTHTNAQLIVTSTSSAAHKGQKRALRLFVVSAHAHSVPRITSIETLSASEAQLRGRTSVYSAG